MSEVRRRTSSIHSIVRYPGHPVISVPEDMDVKMDTHVSSESASLHDLAALAARFEQTYKPARNGETRE